MSISWREKIYALYKGERFITEGTIQEIHEQTNKSISFLRYMTAPVYEKRCGDSVKRLRLIPLDDEEEDDEE
ncbi:hypothetical protein BAMA_16195 [Bacillus manliponensis]|uniref:Uncharacterized protein n=1 Tax=Bacillus manliponensis TaxID=574376 RepID=A0A073K4L1_9BACI|nr:hypothetical protein [Bacillus manliponensis]KEK17233.1 hypothetical protein BAMA_16195 [Bacillus manliponensis]